MSNGVRVGPYTLGRTLGIGSFSKVKLGVHDLTGMKVAIKICNRKKLKKMEMGNKLRTEIDIVRMFAHPHIIRLYEVIDTPTDIYTVMEFIPEGELFDYIVSRGRLDESEARRMFQEIISGVEYCHTHGVVHRDLKPENLLLDSQYHVKIADFGLSNTMNDGFFLKTSCGSPNYAAPEVISGSTYAGPEVDVWSCGVILYAILCGSLPFDDENIRNLFRKIKNGLYHIPSYVSSEAKDLIGKMLVVDPISRIKMSAIRQHPWFQVSLPAYLCLSAEQQIVRTHLVDEGVLKKVCEYGFESQHVLNALALGSELLTQREMADQTQARQMAMVYNLLLDKKRQKDQELQQTKARLLQSTANPKSKQQPKDLKIVSSAPKTKLSMWASGGRWRVGNEFVGEPQAILRHLYKSLKALNFEWKSLSSFKIKARFPSGMRGDQSFEGRKAPTTDVVKIMINLYKRHNCYLLDIQKTFGQTFVFLDLVGKIHTHLQPLAAPKLKTPRRSRTSRSGRNSGDVSSGSTTPRKRTPHGNMSPA